VFSLVQTGGRCRLNFQHEENWSTQSQCNDNVSNIEVMAAAQKLMDTCIDELGVVRGMQSVREIGDCGMHVYSS
jgi:hypothetical protein